MNDQHQDPADTSENRDNAAAEEATRSSEKRQPSKKTSEKAEREQDRQLESGEENPV